MGYGPYRATGDYGRMGQYRGDPGIFGALGKIAGAAIDILPGPVGAIARLGKRALERRAPPSAVGVMPGVPGVMPTAYAAAGPAAAVTQEGKPRRIRKDGKPYKRPTMNVANPRALRRSIRRQAGFVKLARRALKGTGYTVVSRGVRRGARTVVHEAGPGSVTVRG
jgi:hypothetical protein